jgi:serine/threonine-protein kinase RsbW
LSRFAAPGQEEVFQARLSAIPETAAFARAFCAGEGLGQDATRRLTLIIEELFTNTVRHGYGDETDAPIRISLALADDCISVLYEDWAPRYDPLGRFSTSPADLEAELEARREGGLGVYLVGQLVASARYAYEDGANRLWLTLKRGQP